MPTPSNRPSWTTLFAGTTLAWLGLSVMMTVQEATFAVPLQHWLREWLFTAPRFVTGVLGTLIVFAVARTFPVRGRRWKENLSAHVVAALILTALGVATQQLLLRALRPEYAASVLFWEGWWSVLRDRGDMTTLIYTGFVGLYHAIDRGPADAPPEESADPASEPDDETRTADRISVRTGDAIVPVKIAEIEWIEAADSYVRLHLANGDTYLHRSSMTAMTDRLADRPFLRVHRSTIVRIDAVERLETPSAAGHYEVVLRDGPRRRVSDRYRDVLLDALGASS